MNYIILMSNIYICDKNFFREGESTARCQTDAPFMNEVTRMECRHFGQTEAKLRLAA